MAEIRRALLRVWTGRGVGARAARATLLPFSAVYRGATALRRFLYDRRVLRVHQSSIPVVSVGNLSVGGTGKTPFAAWLAREMQARGRLTAIVLRGYGDDEPLVHKRLNESAEVVVSADRVRGIREAVACGADAVVLDDAFQHRRAARDLDILLVSADEWKGGARLLPRGPWREPLAAARRATLIVITCKTAGPGKIERLRGVLASVAPSVPQAVARFVLGDLHSTTTGRTMPLAALGDVKVLAIAAIANPDAFFDQLRAAGATVIPRPYSDHHRFTEREARRLAASGDAVDFVVCTLKDAVKLEALWPPQGGSFWYVSQRVTIEEGASRLDELLDRVFD